MKKRILIVLALLCTFAQGAITGVGEGWNWAGEIAATAIDR
jgi:hypothetical protein